MSSVSNDTVGQLKDFSAETSRRVANILELVSDQLTGAAKSADGFLRTNPWQALAAVALGGIAIGMFLARAGTSNTARSLDDVST